MKTGPCGAAATGIRRTFWNPCTRRCFLTASSGSPTPPNLEMAVSWMSSPGKGHCVPGYVFRVGPEGLLALDDKEGLSYQRIDVVCVKDGGEECPVVPYEVRRERRKQFVKPASRYVGIVAAGLKAFDLDESALRAA